MATINDVCKAAGVSKATVSRVLNNSPQVKEVTRNAVLSVMKELGYQPNTLAQALATNTSNSIGLVLPEFRSSYFGSVLHHAGQAALQAGKKLLVIRSKNSAEGERESVETIANQRCDAILLYSRHLSESELVELQQKIAQPLVILNRQLKAESLSSFGLKQTQLATLAVDHLIQLGHKNIACITSPINSETGRLRLEAYKNQLSVAGTSEKKDWIVEGDNTLEGGYKGAQILLQTGEKFTAIFACNDDMAIGAIRALHDHGLKVPQDVSVIGIDNEPAAAYAIPSLSTVSLPIIRLTQDATALALSLANKQGNLTSHQAYDGELVARESTQAIAGCIIDE
ncbi:LacI family DNA-binding transcriptional regulator [Vibrio diazotrophicus]|uniref:LacI family DNA-binding transcriptional regulator n=1 Tax=Vibrio diazotrophicus TaxID=685 RepID=UPI0022AF72B4|nr:LacI family DNA-binding transcriptional regulator [Vibrio diazotrophicus]MCZ4370951.1 LacI family DNA-binding transcriptional regulator [Vibrio diazotrophicus]